jgi:hypothetical protein
MIGEDQVKASRNARILAGVAGVLAGFGLAAPSALALDGALDTVFDTDGKVTFEPVTGASIADIAAFADGRMVAVGEFQGGADMAVLKRDGSLDSSFSADGLADIPTFAPTEVAVDADGKIVWAAQVSTGQGAQNVTLKVGRNLASGLPDGSFNGDGVNDNVLGNRALDDLVIDSTDRPSWSEASAPTATSRSPSSTRTAIPPRSSGEATAR